MGQHVTNVFGRTCAYVSGHFLGAYLSPTASQTPVIQLTRHLSRRDMRSNKYWWYTYPSAKQEFVSQDDEIPNIWKTIEK